jgi:hypothetical protein
VPLTVVPRPLTVRLDSSNALKLNAPISSNLITSATLPNTINKNNFKVKGAITKKDVSRALNNNVLNNNAKTLEKIKKRRQRIRNCNYRQSLALSKLVVVNS